jgi:D-3-phosphoglycerate dehydrogenase
VVGEFRVGVSADVPRGEGGELRFDLGFGRLDADPDVTWSFLPGPPGADVTPEQVAGLDGLILWSARLPREAIERADRLRVVARLGVGYDTVDVEACTRRGIPVTITPDGVRRGMATSTLLYVLALSHNLRMKDALARAGQWYEAWNHVGTGLTGRTLGLLGAGNIGRELFRIAAPLEMRHVAFDPYVTPEDAAAEGFELVDLDTLTATSDFLCVLAPLTEETRHIVNAERLALMKPSAFLVSVARGPLVDERALVAALRENRIAGAGIDVFEQEPVDPGNPLLKLDNVIVTPHSVCHTDEVFRLIGTSACESVLAVKDGREPRYVVNREALRERQPV